MTEHEWLSEPRPWPLWHHLFDQDLMTDRKQSLICVAACRRVGHLLNDPRSRRIVDACEAYADGELGFDTFIAASHEAFAAARELDAAGAPGENRLAASGAKWLSPDETKQGRALEFSNEVHGYLALLNHGLVTRDEPLNEAVRFWEHPVFLAGQAVEEAAQADVIRELFGNPFRPAGFSPEWRTAAAVQLARQMYDGRHFTLMPILADALEDAGCDSPDVLAHGRDPAAVHVRGCWVVDLVLGKC